MLALAYFLSIGKYFHIEDFLTYLCADAIFILLILILVLGIYIERD